MFYITLLTNQDDDAEELRQFVWDNTNIDAEKLEAHLLANREQLENDEEMMRTFCRSFDAFILPDDGSTLTKAVKPALAYDPEP